MTLRVIDLQARRGGFALTVPSWEAMAGEFQALLGANGAGKSSFFAALAGDIRCRGTVALQGRNIREWTAAERARNVAVLAQQSHIPFAFTAQEVVALGLTPLSVDWREGQRRVRRSMDRCDCEHLADRSYPALSGGERQRVNLARVLLQLSESQGPPVLLLDEPTSAQDLGHQHGMLRMLRDLALNDGYAVVAVLHDLNHALRYAGRCALLADGKLVASGPVRSVLSADRVEQFWGYRPRLGHLGGEPVLL
ncbi:ATP-binding cassette domain-containing protein [Congregibacter litoralis]|uniref:ABC-type cobalamin/Fe3+-siderophores transport system, ATPase component n=1 Tax=Congregibacter litoralis KT71 TaxID=314285 RepID=A4A520_9GAMM|nr:ATP-binding cassette domain-containing protein [Congregibacter litoralis]EAQ98891.1 ABC-type cobalamin/Fe3+-siderophores transport system, ATPase component [Congregibacter litoralis KT71]